MKVLGLDGKEYKLSLADRMVGGDTRPRSAGHLLCRQLLRELFPFDAVCEEVTLPGGPSAMYADFLLPARRLALEVNGRQHAEYVPHYHGSKAGFAKAQKRDRDKRAFFGLNGITLLELDDARTDEWRDAIRSAFLGGPGERPA